MPPCLRATATNMAVVAACARVANDIIYRRLPFLALRPVSDGQYFVSVSQNFLAPQAPKRPPGAFFTFLQAKSAEITQNNPGISLGERAKIAGQMWRDLDIEQRDRLKLDARERYQAYRMEHLKFLDGLSDQERNQYLQGLKSKKESREKRRHRSELRKFGKPKRPPNAYLLFVRSSRLERGDAPLTQFTKGLVEYWKQMPKEEKEIYEDDARIEREKYFREMAEWEDQMKKMGREDLIRKRSQTKPRKRAATKAKKKSAAGKKAVRKTSKKTTRKTSAK